jgi:ATP-dependent RNA helicase SUPV3L1/SUV3
MSLDLAARIRNVTAVLGPTNTGKTHLAIERMLGYDTGLIGLPLRLLAREVYDKIAARAGVDRVALITGEEKIKPEHPRYWVCTVEAMPRHPDVDFLAIDEVQLAADPERGHVFTDRLLHVRGRHETLLLGAQTMRETISDLIPGANFISRPRLSKLTYAGEKKITRLPPRSAVVAFSASEVYAIAELIRRQRGGAAVVLGALSPRTRNAQVALYQSGDVDFLVATDAIGMGLNLDVDHVAFAGVRKFDGHVHRELTPGELGQIAGRAGRHMNDGTFGVTGTVDSLSADLIDRLETHTFDPVKSLQWRNRDLDFASLQRLRDSLCEAPREGRLARARDADDMIALEAVSRDPDVTRFAVSRQNVSRLWDVCQIPDYRKISTQDHSELVATLYKFLMGPEERIPADWFAQQVALADRTDGDIDTLANRIAHIRTWTFVANRVDWLADHEHWQGRTREIEDSLSDALHEQLTQRFVDRRTSALMRGLKEKDELYAEIGEDGAVHVEKHYVGRLMGFRFFPDAQADGIHGKAARDAATHVLARELAMRVRRVVAAKSDAFKLGRDGSIIWRDVEVARLEAGDDPLKPSVVVIADEHLPAPEKEKVRERLVAWLAEQVGGRLKPLVEIDAAQDIAGLARGIAFRLKENFGVLRRESVAEEIRSLDQPARAQLRKYGVRFGAFNIYFPTMLKPACAELAAVLWVLKHGAQNGLDIAAMPELPRPGLTSVATNPATPEVFYRVLGFHVCGPRAVRVDMLERLADLIRALLTWRADPANPSLPPRGATGDGGFKAIPDMMSILGCSSAELGNVLKALGFWVERRRARPVVVAKPASEPVATSPANGAEALPISDAPAIVSVGELPPAAEAAVPVNEVVEPQADSDRVAPMVETAASVVSEEPFVEVAEPVVGDPAEPIAAAEAVIAAAPGAPASAEEEAAPPLTAIAEADQWEEVWRPRRKGRAFEGAPERQRHGQRPRHGQKKQGFRAREQNASKPAEPQPAVQQGNDARVAKEQQRQSQHGKGHGHRRPERRRGGPGEHQDRPRIAVHASPPKPKVAFDPDSPFAALSSLKAALEKRSQE